ncbi:protein RoBo-1 isoform X2 [Phodopus roborovskii]|nr:protein RoBo-1 isoform X2 [Phodopus roborovskii]
MGVTMSWSSVLKGVLAVCIFTHLFVSSVESYSCDNKECYNGRCKPNPRTCESSKGCFHLEQEFKTPTPSTNVRVQQKGCSKDGCTELAFSATLGRNRTFRYDHQCCYTDQCNREPKPVFPPSAQQNGVECPACYSNDDTCNTVSLKCTGVETKCVEVIGTDVIGTLSHFVIRGMGCATETACNLKNMTIIENVKIHTYCFSGSPSLRPISFVLAGLFLMKALL